MNTKDGGPAFPCAVFDPDVDSYRDEHGLSIRDYFAAKAMQALITEPAWPNVDSGLTADLCGDAAIQMIPQDRYATAAYMLADAMLRARTNT